MVTRCVVTAANIDFFQQSYVLVKRYVFAKGYQVYFSVFLDNAFSRFNEYCTVIDLTVFGIIDRCACEYGRVYALRECIDTFLINAGKRKKDPAILRDRVTD